MEEKKFSTKTVSIPSSHTSHTSKVIVNPRDKDRDKDSSVKKEVGSSSPLSPLSPLRKRMIEDMDLHGYAAKTKEIFQKSVMELGKFFNKNPGDITEEEIRKYFLVLKNDETKSPHIIKNHYYGIRFFSRRH
jgi:integrase/recombinase XerD